MFNPKNIKKRKNIKKIYFFILNFIIKNIYKNKI